MQRQGYLNLRDMVDGGGPGRSGTQFGGGGSLSDLGNLMLRERAFQQQWAEQQRQRPPTLFQSLFAPQQGYGAFGHNQSGARRQRPGLGEYQGILDMFDGGGPGQSGDTFQGGGLLSALANLGRNDV